MEICQSNAWTWKFPQKVPSPLILCALDCTLYNSKLVRWAPLEKYRASQGKNYDIEYEIGTCGQYEYDW